MEPDGSEADPDRAAGTVPPRPQVLTAVTSPAVTSVTTPSSVQPTFATPVRPGVRRFCEEPSRRILPARACLKEDVRMHAICAHLRTRARAHDQHVPVLEFV